MSTKYHSRSSYEQLYGWLLRDTGKAGYKASTMNDQELLMTINYILIESKCQPLSLKELKAQLH
jgi:hypothetical protein